MDGSLLRTVDKAYGAMLACGGVAGFVSKKSIVSLIAGVGSGVLMALPGVPGRVKHAWNFVLLAVMAFRGVRSGKVMPAGLVAVLAAGMIALRTIVNKNKNKNKNKNSNTNNKTNNNTNNNKTNDKNTNNNSNTKQKAPSDPPLVVAILVAGDDDARRDPSAFLDRKMENFLLKNREVQDPNKRGWVHVPRALTEIGCVCGGELS